MNQREREQESLRALGGLLHADESPRLEAASITRGLTCRAASVRYAAETLFENKQGYEVRRSAFETIVNAAKDLEAELAEKEARVRELEGRRREMRQLLHRLTKYVKAPEIQEVIGTTRLARLTDQAADYLARTGEPVDILRGGDAAPPAPAPGELAAGIEFCKRPGSGVPTNVIAAAEAWARLQWRKASEAPITNATHIDSGDLPDPVLVNAGAIYIGSKSHDGRWFDVYGEELSGVLGWLPLDALPPAPGASDGE